MINQVKFENFIIEIKMKTYFFFTYFEVGDRH